jgi:hypothetical protein
MAFDVGCLKNLGVMYLVPANKLQQAALNQTDNAVSGYSFLFTRMMFNVRLCNAVVLSERWCNVNCGGESYYDFVYLSSKNFQ